MATKRKAKDRVMFEVRRISDGHSFGVFKTWSRATEECGYWNWNYDQGRREKLVRIARVVVTELPARRAT